MAGESYGAGNYKATNGRLYKVSDDGTEGTPLAWYPAPGFRYSYSGEPVNVGYYGFSWASATVGIGGLDLSFYTQGLNTSGADYRAHGFQLRCLSHPKGVLMAVSTPKLLAASTPQPAAPPRATAIVWMACRVTSATTGTVGRRRSAAPMAWTCISACRPAIPVARTVAPTDVSCVASRNKRRRTAPGYRDPGHHGQPGTLFSVGNSGFSWSCTPVTDGVTVRYLGFGTQNLNPSNAHNRAHGFQLRCLSE